jgi:hypothetical protein
LAKESEVTDARLPSEEAPAIRPFRVSFPQADFDDLRRRIAATRWPDREQVNDASQGVQLATTQALARYWTNDYDFRRLEAKLNAYLSDVEVDAGLGFAVNR